MQVCFLKLVLQINQETASEDQSINQSIIHFNLKSFPLFGLPVQEKTTFRPSIPESPAPLTLFDVRFFSLHFFPDFTVNFESQRSCSRRGESVSNLCIPIYAQSRLRQQISILVVGCNDGESEAEI